MHYALQGNKYPIETSEHVKTAAEYFTKNLDRFAPSDRVEIAYNLEKRAEDLGVDLTNSWIDNYSRMMKKEASYSPEFEQNMKTRKGLCVSHDVAINVNGSMVKAASIIDQLVAEKDSTAPIKMVAAIHDFDKFASLESHYDTRVKDPVFTVYGSDHNPYFDMQKVAGCCTKKIKKMAKNKKFIEKVSSIMGEKLASDFQASPVGVFSSLHSNEQQLLLEQM